ncbi:DUF2663 family protein [Bacillus sp. N9]
MDSIIYEKEVDEATNQMLQNLIKKKLKSNRYKTTHFILLSIATMYSISAFYYVYTRLIGTTRQSVLDLVSSLLNHSLFLYLGLIGFILFGSVKIYFDKKRRPKRIS